MSTIPAAPLTIPLTKNPPVTIGQQTNNGYYINIGIPGCIGHQHWNVLIDTGSCGLVIPAGLLYESGVALQGNLISGVTQVGTQTVKIPYQPSGVFLDGYIYQLDSINIGVDAEGNNAAYTANNVQIVGVYNNTKPGLGMMGVGFGRPHPFADNLLLAAGVNPSYLLTTTSLTLGLTQQALPSGYQFQNLQRGTTDWITPTATITVAGTQGSRQFTGTALLDTGINSMMLSLPGDGWKAALPGQTVGISWAGNAANSSILSYTFNVGAPQTSPPNSLSTSGSNGRPSGLIPVAPSDPAAEASVFVNVGINPIQLANYFYDSQAGVVGFLQT